MVGLFNRFLYSMCLLQLFPSNGKCETKQRGNYKGLYSQEVANYEVVVPQRVDEHGKFISNLIPHHYNKRSTKDSDLIYYKLPVAGEEYIIQLTPNLKFISPGAVVEIRGKGSESGTVSKDEKLGRMFENLRIKKLQSGDCHYSGVVRGVISSKVALSTCFGLAGFIQTKNGTYTIEPVAQYDVTTEEEHPHILYKNDENHNWTVCDTIDFSGNRTVREIKESAYNPNASAMQYPIYIETLIVTDKTLLSHEEFDAENYILTLFNMAFSLFHDASLGFLTKLSLVRMIQLEVDEDGMDVNENQDAKRTLEAFQEWQYRINPTDDTHPNHHDVAILITRVDTFSNLSSGFLGVSTLGTACDKKQSAILCRDNGLRLGFVMAHEIAHLLGAEHDGFNNSCPGVDGDGFRTVMHPQVLLTTETWSKCTQGYMKAFLQSGLGNCLYDEPKEHHFNVQDLLPGTIYDADFQCKQLLTHSARECDEGSTCSSLNCQIPGQLCIIMNVPPAAGTRCGENMWCRQKKCLMVGERPDAIDGNWGDWSPWSDCSRTCGSGVATSDRLCNRPVPSHGGRYCLGRSRRHRICSSRPCDMSQPSFRDLQCGEHDDWIYPEDGLKHTWKEYDYPEGNPCILYCINENLEVVALKPRVIDGTPCHKGMKDICVDGVCRAIPCDLNMESNAIEDVCGVCHGDGTTCEFSQGELSLEQCPKALTKLISVPIGTRNVKVEEVMPSAARILVRDRETRDFYVRGRKLGIYSVPGSQAWLGMLKIKQEALTIPGPVTRALTIWIERVENVTVKWSMALPTTQQRKPEFTWDFVQWSPCSALCGPGTQKSEPSCIEEKAGLVENSYCADLEIPPAKVRSCEVAECEPRWMVADWRDNKSGNSSVKMKMRMVYCVKTSGEGEGEYDILPDSECSPPKPEEEEPCDPREVQEGRYKRDSSEHVITKKSVAQDGELDDSNDDMDMSGFSSNRMKFGSHKKYDEYLKNFNAIATPQRKSETIPLHIVDTPHFKHYYRVLKTSDSGSTELETEINLDKTLSDAKEDIKTKTSSLLSQIYKNTFSGNQQNYRGHEKSAWDAPERRRKTLRLLRRKCRCYRPHRGTSPRTHHSDKKHTFFMPVRYHGESFRKRKNKKIGGLGAHIRLGDLESDEFFRIGKHRKRSIKSDSARKEHNKQPQRRRKSPHAKQGKTPENGSKNTLESESINLENSQENYTIRFGQVMIDKDEDADLEIIFEEGDKGDFMELASLRSSDGEKVWKIKGNEAIKFLQNITAIDYGNKTATDEPDK